MSGTNPGPLLELENCIEGFAEMQIVNPVSAQVHYLRDAWDMDNMVCEILELVLDRDNTM